MDGIGRPAGRRWKRAKGFRESVRRKDTNHSDRSVALPACLPAGRKGKERRKEGVAEEEAGQLRR